MKRHESFSLFNRKHLERAHILIRILMGMPDVESFFAACVYARDRLNTHLFVYAVSVAVYHRNDTKNVVLPSNVQVLPHLYVNNKVFAPLKEELGVIPEKFRNPVENTNGPTASDLDIEHRVAYWREDLGLNLHHWHWHLVYPFGFTEADLPVVNKDRRGELFYYMHQQIVARYNFERLSNQLARVRRLNDFKEPIMEGYYPKLHNMATGRDWPSRQPFSFWRDLNREKSTDEVIIDVLQVHRWRDVIMNAISDQRLLKNDGTYVSLNSEQGIDYLGNIIEASILSVNFNRYGDLHNSGHMMMGYIHDPDYRYLEDVGVMGDNSTAMRDPAFYLWHAYIDDIFVAHKELLAPYTQAELNFDGITVQEITVKVDNGRDNEFSTYFEQHTIDINKGLDYLPRGSSPILISHLQHAPFTFNIQVNNSGAERNGTVRIFMAPREDERNEDFVFRHQRRLFIELDRFVVTLKNGSNLIKQPSKFSSVTIPFEQIFSADERQNNKTNYCKCGWPDYLLIPKGNAEGLPADLFVMVSDAQKDFEPGKYLPTVTGEKECKPAPEYCGLRGEKYPDKRAMGYPFDRLPRAGVSKLEQFLTPNMFVQKVDIKFDSKAKANSLKV